MGSATVLITANHVLFLAEKSDHEKNFLTGLLEEVSKDVQEENKSALQVFTKVAVQDVVITWL